jgi:hypothetical protein
MASRLAKRVLVGIGVVVAAVAALHAVNHARLDAGALRANAEPILAEARALGERAKPEYQELALATLPPNPRTGSYFRLDDMLDRAVVKQAPPAATGEDAVIQALESTTPNRRNSWPRGRTAPRSPCATARWRWSTNPTTTWSTRCP